MQHCTTTADEDRSLAWLARTAATSGYAASCILAALLAQTDNLNTVEQSGLTRTSVAVVDQCAGVDAQLDRHLNKT